MAQKEKGHFKGYMHQTS